jgi:hypothetical protein
MAWVDIVFVASAVLMQQCFGINSNGELVPT